MERNAHSDLTFRLKVEETVNISANSSTLTASIQYKNTGDKITNYAFYGKISINGNVIAEKEVLSTNYISLSNDGEYHDISGTWMKAVQTCQHDSSGGGSFTASAEIKADKIAVYWTVGSAEMSQSLTAIDQTAPTISNLSVSADRYGLNASALFTAAHASYSLTKVRFELKCLTEAQAKNRVGKVTQASTSSYVYDSGRNAYTLILEKTSNLSTSTSITLDLDCIDEKSYPLTSGKVYEYGIILTALNGKTYTKLGSFTVPQKVTGITCDSVINIMQGNTAQLNYTVIPTNAQLQTVTFSSSNTAVATVDENGIVTAKETSEAFATAVITVKTTDGGYTAKCTVNVTTTAAFPHLPTVTQYLTAELFSSIIYALAIVRSELVEAGATVASLSGISITGKNEPVISIMPAFKSVESDCQKLRSAAAALDLSTDPLPSTAQTINKQNTDWLIVVNNWIDFLNSLHSQLGGV